MLFRSLMENERELAAVLGHEVGHIVNRDSVKGMQRDLLIQVSAAIAADAIGGRGGQTAELATKVVGQLANLKYSRDQEYRADLYGIKSMAAVGYNPWGAVELLQHLQQASGDQGGRLGEMLSTHPLPSSRIDKARETVREEYPAAEPDTRDPNRSQFNRMKARL